MSSSGDADIYIGIKVNTDELVKANELAKELATNLDKFRRTSGQAVSSSATSQTREFSTAMGDLRTSMISVPPAADRTFQAMVALANSSEVTKKNILGASSSLAKLPGLLGMNTDQFINLWDTIKELPSDNLQSFTKGMSEMANSSSPATQKLGNQILGLSTLWHRATGEADQFNEAVKGITGTAISNTDIKEAFTTPEFKLSDSGIKKIVNSLREGGVKEVTNQMKQAQLETAKLEKEMAKLGKYGSDLIPITSNLKALGIEEGRTKTLTEAMNNAHRLGKDELQQLSAVTGMTVPELVNFGRAAEKAGNDMQVMKTYMQHTRSAIGPLGMAFREVTMQMYWASLGFLFYTMTLTRADQAEYTKLQNANALSKTYYNLYKLEENLIEVERKYGSASKEARDANAQMVMSEKDAELQKKQLAVTIKTQTLQNMQSYLSMIPLVVNSMYLMIQASASLQGFKAAAAKQDNLSTQAKMREAFATQQQANAEVQSAVTTQMDTSAKTGNITTTNILGDANAGAAVKTWGLVAAMKALFTMQSLVTMGVGAAIALGSTFAMNAIAEREAKRQMEEINREAQMSANSLYGMSDAIQNVDYHLTGNTLSKSAKIAANEIKNLRGELNQVKDTGNLDINANVGGSLKSLAVSVHLHNPVVREDNDIQMITDSIYKSLMKEFSAAGVKP